MKFWRFIKTKMIKKQVMMIYFYIYQNINNNIGKYSDKFKLLYKNNNYKSKKQIFRKKL